MLCSLAKRQQEMLAIETVQEIVAFGRVADPTWCKFCQEEEEEEGHETSDDSSSRSWLGKVYDYIFG